MASHFERLDQGESAARDQLSGLHEELERIHKQIADAEDRLRRLAITRETLKSLPADPPPAAPEQTSTAHQSAPAEQELAKQAAGELWTDSDFVFTTRCGTPFEPRNFNHRFVDRSARAGVRRIRLHDTRRALRELGKHPGKQDRK
ncbi:hypothetical protein QQY66_20025 [Streptomyces sp. DG2A-72]|uniref:hypothetical protein n=1 Tax=Streptomyces sp. DG2A-72 TaxID=3051386 RepID=UPI00265C0ED9|nr:hypothetical protein [Streptomyces sp. DG2A-72]MDO0933861.1 hypothetical protein [Streptomyces sp. DG2A-72]